MKCLNCSSKKTVKKGKQRNKLKISQRFQCKSCKKYFTDNITKNKTYDIKVVLDSLMFTLFCIL